MMLIKYVFTKKNMKIKKLINKTFLKNSLASCTPAR